MTHTGPMSEDEGTFGEYQNDPTLTCPHCQVTGDVLFRVWESNDGAYEDTKYLCVNCHTMWWVDGIDA